MIALAGVPATMPSFVMTVLAKLISLAARPMFDFERNGRSFIEVRRRQVLLLAVDQILAHQAQQSAKLGHLDRDVLGLLLGALTTMRESRSYGKSVAPDFSVAASKPSPVVSFQELKLVPAPEQLLRVASAQVDVLDDFVDVVDRGCRR